MCFLVTVTGYYQLPDDEYSTNLEKENSSVQEKEAIK
jgi:hypothetical protein